MHSFSTALRVGAVAFCVAVLPQAHAQDMGIPGITVTGEAAIAVEPDMADIRAGVVLQGKTAREASEASARAVAALIGALREAGVEAKDIRTSRVSLQPVMSRPQEGRSEAPRVTGYQATNGLTVTVRPVSSASEILDRLIAAGANQVSGISFRVFNTRKPLDEARTQAVADARRKAELYATAAGVQLGRLIAIAETGSSAPPSPLLRAAPASTPISPGEEKLSVSISASFEIVR